MSKLLTVEEALSLLVNMDFIPDGETVLSMAEAFLEEATAEYNNANNSDKNLLRLKLRMDVCEARCKLVLMLMDSLAEYELSSNNSLIEYDEDTSVGNPLLTRISLGKWAYDRFGINIPNTGLFEGISIENVAKLAEHISKNNTKQPSWQDVTIKIQADYKIRYKLDEAKWSVKSFADTDLINKSNNQPNMSGLILIGLSLKYKYPKYRKHPIDSKYKTAISKLRIKLNELTKVPGDAFYTYNLDDGYKPKFKLIDDRKNADERAEKEAIHEIFGDQAETIEYNNHGIGKNDLGSKFLKEYE